MIYIIMDTYKLMIFVDDKSSLITSWVKYINCHVIFLNQYSFYNVIIIMLVYGEIKLEWK